MVKVVQIRIDPWVLPIRVQGEAPGYTHLGVFHVVVVERLLLLNAIRTVLGSVTITTATYRDSTARSTSATTRGSNCGTRGGSGNRGVSFREEGAMAVRLCRSGTQSRGRHLRGTRVTPVVALGVHPEDSESLRAGPFLDASVLRTHAVGSV